MSSHRFYCGADQFPGDPESPECDLLVDDPHEDGLHRRHDATGGCNAEWEVES